MEHSRNAEDLVGTIHRMLLHLRLEIDTPKLSSPKLYTPKNHTPKQCPSLGVTARRVQN